MTFDHHDAGTICEALDVLASIEPGRAKTAERLIKCIAEAHNLRQCGRCDCFRRRQDVGRTSHGYDECDQCQAAREQGWTPNG